ncbi:MAG: 2-dehydropantoate 2-reductase [Betaproteobacteria bacterium]
MKIAVMGAGAVGCYYGGMLARASHEVTLIGRAPHVEAVLRDGLLMDTQSFREYVPTLASTEASAVKGAELVLFCVKSTDTAASTTAIAPHLDAEAIVLSLQNGVDNTERLQTHLSCLVAPAVVYVATEMAGPGHLKHHGRGELVIGPEAASRGLEKVFSAAGVPIEVSDNVTGALWAKLILNCVYNALSAITQLPYGRLVQGTGVEQLMREIVQECLAVAHGEGVTVPGDTWEAVERIARTMPNQLSSTAQDLARGKLSEIDFINGHILRKGAALGIATPINQTLHTLVKLIEGRSWQISS